MNKKVTLVAVKVIAIAVNLENQIYSNYIK